MKLKSIMVSVTIVSMILLGTIAWLGGLQDGYSEEIDLEGVNYTSGELKSKLDRQQNLSNQTFETLKALPFGNENLGTSLFYAPYNMMKLGWQSLLVFFGSWDTFFTILSESVNNLSVLGIPVPSWLIIGILTIVMIGVIILLIEMFFRWKLEN